MCIRDRYRSANQVQGTEALYDSPSFFKDYVDYIDALVARYADTGIVGMTSIGKSVRGRDI